MFTTNIYKRAQSAQCALALYFQQLRTNAGACNVHSDVHNVHFSTSYRESRRLHYSNKPNAGLSNPDSPPQEANIALLGDPMSVGQKIR
jgi:hypothetical protein